MYVTNALTSFTKAGPSRVAGLLSSARRLYGGKPGMVHSLVKQLDASLAGISAKKKEEVMRIANKIDQTLSDNMPFVLDQYREAIETMTSHAKAELDAAVVHTATKLGLKSLKALSEKEPS
jgi:hypothetical protein